MNDLALTVRLKADGSGLRGELRVSKDEIAKLKRELGDADGNELPPEQARAAVLDTPQAVSAIAKEIYEINRGRPFAGADGPRDRKPGRRR